MVKDRLESYTNKDGYTCMSPKTMETFGRQASTIGSKYVIASLLVGLITFGALAGYFGYMAFNPIPCQDCPDQDDCPTCTNETIYVPTYVNVTPARTTLNYSVNLTFPFFGDAIDNTEVNMTSISMLILFTMDDKFHDWVDSGYTIDIPICGLEALEMSDGKNNTGGCNVTFDPWFAIVVAQLEFNIYWAKNATEVSYTVGFLFGLDISLLTLETPTFYNYVFGGVHYNTAISDIDYSSHNLNGHEVNALIEIAT